MTPHPHPDEASEQVEAYGAEKVLIRAWLSDDALEGTHLQPREIHRLAARIRGYMDLCAAQAAQRENAAIIDVIRERLVYDSQRAVSWHEIQDCLDMLRARHAATKENK